jgi:hypothetical protein
VSREPDVHDGCVHAIDCSADPVHGKGRVEFIRHAIDRLRDRGIGEDDVIRTIRFPDHEGLPADEGRHHVRRELSRSVGLDVIYMIGPESVVVITAYVRTRRISGRY